jgi:hypothetical protein
VPEAEPSLSFPRLHPIAERGLRCPSSHQQLASRLRTLTNTMAAFARSLFLLALILAASSAALGSAERECMPHDSGGRNESRNDGIGAAAVPPQPPPSPPSAC